MKQYILGITAMSLLFLSACRSKLLIDLDTITTSQKIEMNVGQSYTVKVKENPTTGYSWKTESSKDCVVSVTDSQYEQDPNPTRMIGKGGVRSFILKADKPGSCNMKFRYNRAGNPEGETVKQLDIKVK